MPKGGKRAGAGRPRKDGTCELWFKLPAETRDRFKALIPRGHRSEFLSDCLAAALRTRELLDQSRWGEKRLRSHNDK